MFGTDRILRAPNVLDIDVRQGQDMSLTSCDMCEVGGGIYGDNLYTFAIKNIAY